MKRDSTANPANESVSLADDGFVAVAEAAQFLGLSRAKVYQIMESGQLPFAKFGKSRRIPRRALLAYGERCMMGA